jgi:hypothetical protein
MTRWGMRAAIHAIRTSMNSCAGLLAQGGAGPDSFDQLIRAREQLDQLEFDAARVDGVQRAH